MQCPFYEGETVRQCSARQIPYIPSIGDIERCCADEYNGCMHHERKLAAAVVQVSTVQCRSVRN
ncbi:MAG: hypothetical protein HZA15_04145 [Nitrospirae bacterium]|nr:hypothetical protein [Nitrospirota bacterium]